MKLYEWLTLFGLVSGPVFAVLITLWVEGRRRSREQRITVLRMLISTRHLPSDPAFQVAINLIPIEFSRDQKVMAAHREFVEAVAAKLDGVNDETILAKTGTKTVRLVFEGGTSARISSEGNRLADYWIRLRRLGKARQSGFGLTEGNARHRYSSDASNSHHGWRSHAR